MKLIKKQNNKKGFTLIELVIVIAILAILALILIPAMSGYIGSADKSKNQADARSVYTAASIVVAEEPTIDDGTVSDGEIIKKIVEKANLEGKGDVTEVIVKKGAVDKIIFKPSKGDSIEFDGKDFKPIK